MTCPSLGTDIRDIANSFNNKCSCNNTTTHFKFYYTCRAINDGSNINVDPSKKGGLYYNSMFNPGIIEISTANALSGTAFESYILEIWYFPDNVFETTIIYNAPSPAPISRKNHVFYTNIFQIFADGNSSYDYYSVFINNSVKKSIVDTPLNKMISKLEWNRLLINVKYDPAITPNSYTADLYTKNKLQTAYKFNLGSSSTSLQLSKVVFTHNDQTGRYPNVFWGSGYYRNLRVWNGDQISVWGVIKYND